MLEDTKNIQNLGRGGDKRALPDASLNPESSTSDLLSWLTGFLRPKDIKQLDIKSFGASDLLVLESEEVR